MVTGKVDLFHKPPPLHLQATRQKISLTKKIAAPKLIYHKPARRILTMISRFLVIGLICAATFGAKASFAAPDEYDDSQSNPFRIAAYLMYPVGWLAEWIVFRPFHFMVSATEPQEAFLVTVRTRRWWQNLRHGMTSGQPHGLPLNKPQCRPERRLGCPHKKRSTPLEC